MGADDNQSFAPTQGLLLSRETHVQIALTTHRFKPASQCANCRRSPPACPGRRIFAPALGFLEANLVVCRPFRQAPVPRRPAPAGAIEYRRGAKWLVVVRF